MESQEEQSINSSNISMAPGRADGSKEGWLELPSAKGTRHGWISHMVVLVDMKLFFYAGESERKLNKPKMIIDLEKVSNQLYIRDFKQFLAISREASNAC